MTPPRSPVVIDTDVYGADMVADAPLADRYESIIVGRPAFLSFQTVAELRYGALHRNWGEARRRKLDAKIAAAEIVHSGDDLVGVYASFAPNACASATTSGNVNTMPTDGSPPPRFGSASRSCPTTASSKARPASSSSRLTADHLARTIRRDRESDVGSACRCVSASAGSSRRESVTKL